VIIKVENDARDRILEASLVSLGVRRLQPKDKSHTKEISICYTSYSVKDVRHPGQAEFTVHV
jgi:hypothetical protein